jgi:peptide/nickel transport system substrate-binding protein
MGQFDTQTESGIWLDRRTLLAGAAAVAAVLATSCGKKEEAPAAAAPSDAIKKGGTLRLGMEGGSPSDSLDPLTYADSIPIAMSLMLYNCLVEIADNGEIGRAHV